MIFPLRIQTVTETEFILSTSRIWRLVFMFLFLFLLTGMILIRAAPVLMILFSCICLLSSLLSERWVFRRSGRTAEHFSGIVVIGKKKTYSLDDFSEVAVSSAASFAFDKPKSPLDRDPVMPELLRKGRATLRIHHKNAALKPILLDDGSHRERTELEKTGRSLANWCGLPFRLGGEAD